MALKYDDFYHPFGRGSAAVNFSNKIKDLKERYFTTISKDILVSCVYDRNRDRYSFFFKLPSEQNKDYPTALMYDVILEFNPNSQKRKELRDASSIKDYEIYIFSNSPGFVFTFDYVIKHKYKAFPKILPNNLLSKIAVSQPPEVRNRMEVMTIEKTTWWSLFHLEHNGYFDKNTLETIKSKKGEKFFLNQIISQPLKLKEINDMKKIVKEEKQKQLSRENKKHEKNYSKVTVNPLSHSMEKSMEALPTKGLSNNSLKKDLSHKFKTSKYFKK